MSRSRGPAAHTLAVDISQLGVVVTPDADDKLATKVGRGYRIRARTHISQLDIDYFSEDWIRVGWEVELSEVPGHSRVFGNRNDALKFILFGFVRPRTGVVENIPVRQPKPARKPLRATPAGSQLVPEII